FREDVLIGDKTTANGFPVSFETHQLHPVVTFRMVHEGTIAGRVRDAEGHARTGVMVKVLATRVHDDLTRLDEVKSVETNDFGEYRILGLQPGKYYAKIGNNAFLMDGADGHLLVAGPTYFPEAHDIRFAKPIDIHEGSAITGIDFNDSPAPEGVKVSGAVI